MLVPRGARIAGTELDLHFVPTIHVDDGEVARWRVNGAWITGMPEVADESKRVEGGSFKEPILPEL